MGSSLLLASTFFTKGVKQVEDEMPKISTRFSSGKNRDYEELPLNELLYWIHLVFHGSIFLQCILKIGKPYEDINRSLMMTIRMAIVHSGSITLDYFLLSFVCLLYCLLVFIYNTAYCNRHNDWDKILWYMKRLWQIVWRNVLGFVYLHAAAFYAFYLAFNGKVKVYTYIFSLTFAILAGMGVTAGAHRLWAHQAYKARWPLRLMLVILQTMAFQNHIYEWVRDHRVHHKFTETDADPHNAKRGFFFSHMGWLMVRKHKDVFEKGCTIDLSDLEKDPIVMWQKKTYLVVMPLLCFVIPAWIPYHFWNEEPWSSWYFAAMARYTLSLHFTWLVNSAAHIWGNKPYDKNIGATDNKTVAIFAFGEGWHNYHHVFPWDYKAAELGNYSTNLSTGLIDLAAKLGLAYNLRTVSVEMINKRVMRTGDGSHPSSNAVKDSHDDHHHPENPIWGWEDKDLTEEDRQYAEIHKKLE